MPLLKSFIPVSALPLLLAGQSPIPIPGRPVERPGACEITLSPEPLFVAGRGERSTDILHRVAGGVILPTGDVVIANAGDFELRWHDARGRLVRTAGRRGGGPGEFTALAGVWLVRDSLVMAHDFGASRLSQIPKPRLLPAIDQLHHDDQGRIWIRPFEHPGQGPRVWQVFAGGTSRVCTAVLPPRTRILDLRGQHLLALVRSPDGVEQVRLYAFIEGTE